LSRTFAFLRALNVGGHTVTMAQLKSLFEGAGLRGVETFIASGNVLFDAGPEPEPALRTHLEAHLREALGYEVATFLRSEAELAALIRCCPYAEAESASAKALNVALLQAPITEDQQARLQAMTTEMDTFRFSGREVWWRCQVKQSESKFSNAVFERALKVQATFRGYNTLQRLAAKHMKG